jgi:DNA repair protein RadC
MTIDQLFGPEKVPAKLRKIRIKQIKAVYEKLVITEEIDQYLQPLKKYSNPEQIFDTFHFLQHETKEYFMALHLDAKNRICCVDEVSIGSLNQAIVHPREVFKTALLSSAAAIILLHNHPSGDPTPSREDIEITKRLKKAGEVLGIILIDHIIIGEHYVSLASHDLF